MKRNKILSLTAAVLFLSLIFCLFACNEKLDDMEYRIENDEAHICSYTDKTTVTEITVPDEIDGFKVTAIDDFGIVNAESLIKINIGKNVKEIGCWAFTNNRNLREFSVDVENPYFKSVDGVLYTKDGKTLVFYPAAKGVELAPDKTVKTYGEYAILEGVERVRSKAFYKCSEIKTVVFPSTLKVIEEKAFHRCSNLTQAVFYEGLEKIEKDGFAYCSSLTEITLPSSITELGEYAFYNCTALKKIVVKRAEGSFSVGKKWYPTDNGRDIKDLEIVYEE